MTSGAHTIRRSKETLLVGYEHLSPVKNASSFVLVPKEEVIVISVSEVECGYSASCFTRVLEPRVASIHMDIFLLDRTIQ